MTSAQLETYLTLPELADHTRTTVWTVRSWIKRGQGPRVTKLGGKVLFALTDVIEWERERREASG